MVIESIALDRPGAQESPEVTEVDSVTGVAGGDVCVILILVSCHRTPVLILLLHLDILQTSLPRPLLRASLPPPSRRLLPSAAAITLCHSTFQLLVTLGMMILMLWGQFSLLALLTTESRLATHFFSNFSIFFPFFVYFSTNFFSRLSWVPR